MIVQSISEISIAAVLHRGIANKECVALKINQTVNLGQFGMMLGYQQSTELATPFTDCLFWFGDGVVEAKEWIFVYSCAGSPRKTQSKDGQTMYVVHWGRDLTMFANTNIVPILFRVDAVQIGQGPVDQPQHAALIHQ